MIWPIEIFLLLVVSIAVVVAVHAYWRVGGVMTRVDTLERRLVALRRQIDDRDEAKLQDANVPLPRREDTAPEPAESGTDSSGQAGSPEARPDDESIETGMVSGGDPGIETEESLSKTWPPRLAANTGTFEERLTSRWLVWLGGAVLAAGGIFLVKYSMDRGWIGPVPRVVLGVLFGLALIAGGEWLRRRPLQRAIASVRPDYVPQALSAAGVLILFASIYVAYALYGLLPPLVAFVALAMIAFAALALALLQGPVIAALGGLAAYGVPALVSTQSPSAWALFPYLLAVAAGCLSVRRYRAWEWLGWGALAGVLVWPVLWLLHPITLGDEIAMGGFLILAAAMFSFLRPLAELEDVRLKVPERAKRWIGEDLYELGIPPLLATAALLGVAVLFCVLLAADKYGPATRLLAGLYCVFVLLLAWREVVFWGPLALVAGAALYAMAAWVPDLPIAVLLHQQTEAGLDVAGPIPRAILPPELVPFGFALVVLAFVFACGGFAAMWRRPIPAYWASLSGGFVVLALVLGYAVLNEFWPDAGWGALALCLAIITLVATVLVGRKRDLPGMNGSLGAYAATTVALVSLAAAMVLENAWLTVAIAVELVALAWIHVTLDLRPMRVLAWILGTIILLRLTLNPYFLDYPLGGTPGFNWFLYGYGLPAACFYVAAHWFRQTADDRLVVLLEAGALVFAVCLVSFEIRELVRPGDVWSMGYGLFEQSLHNFAWLAMAVGLMRLNARSPRPVSAVGWQVLLGLASLQMVVFQLTFDNPLMTGKPVWGVAVFNLLLLAYAVPAGMALLVRREAQARGLNRLADGAGAAALVLVFVYLSLQVRYLFQGPVIGFGPTSDAEWYSYSLAWLLYAGGLLALGMVLGSRALRWASLGLVLLTLAKLVLFDASALTGLWRVASFLGLGLALVGIGYLYQRFVFPPGPGDVGETEVGEMQGNPDAR